MEQISPTRTELLSRRGQIGLARQGADLLRSKREALVREFLAELRKFTEAREAMMKSLADATQALMLALAVDGKESLASAALAMRQPVDVELDESNIWGVRVVEVSSSYKPRVPFDRGYTAFGASSRIDETAERFENALQRILEVAPADRKLRVLGEEIRKTSRRVNALEHRVLPRLEEEVRYIRGVLDQREREDLFRLKRLKKKRD